MSNPDGTIIQLNFKTGPGYEATLINLYAESVDDLDALLAAVSERAQDILSTQQLLQAAGTVAAQLPLQGGAQPDEAQATAHVPAERPALETQEDRYGGKWTYGHPDAPALPDGRGYYAMKEWKAKSGKFMKAWVDPAKGPKPFNRGSVEAELIWI